MSKSWRRLARRGDDVRVD